MLLYLTVFAATFALDYVWTRYIAEVGAKSPGWAAFWSMSMIPLGAVNVIGYTTNRWLVFPAMLGAFASTYWAVRRDGRPTADQKVKALRDYQKAAVRHLERWAPAEVMPPVAPTGSGKSRPAPVDGSGPSHEVALLRVWPTETERVATGRKPYSCKGNPLADCGEHDDFDYCRGCMTYRTGRAVRGCALRESSQPLTKPVL